MSTDGKIGAEFLGITTEDPTKDWTNCWDWVCLVTPMPMESAVFVDGQASCSLSTITRLAFNGGNVWSGLGSLSSASQIAISQDGTLLLATSTNKIYSHYWDGNAFSWTQILDSSGISIKEIAVADRGHLWALDTAGKLYQYDLSQSKFVLKVSSPTMQHLTAASQDAGDLPLFASSGSTLYHFTGASYQNIATAPATITKLAASTVYVPYELGTFVYWIDSANNIYQYGYNGSSSSVTAISETGLTGTFSSLAAAHDGTLWVLNSAHQIFQRGHTGGTWTAITGKSANQIAIGSQFDTYVLDSNDAPYKFWSGTNNARMTITNSDGSVSAQDFAPFTNVAPGAQFTGQDSAKVLQLCPGLPPAVLLNTGWIEDHFEIAYTRNLYAGGPRTNCVMTDDGHMICDYPVIPWCTAATSPPDYNPPAIHSELHSYFESFAACIRFHAPGPWACSPGASPGFDGVPPLANCTKNP